MAEANFTAQPRIRENDAVQAAVDRLAEALC